MTPKYEASQKHTDEQKLELNGPQITPGAAQEHISGSVTLCEEK